MAHFAAFISTTQAHHLKQPGVPAQAEPYLEVLKQRIQEYGVPTAAEKERFGAASLVAAPRPSPSGARL